MGADRAILIESMHTLEPLAVAKLLKALVLREKPSLVLLGKQAVDDDAGQTGQMLAALLDYPQATFVSKLAIDSNEVTATREVDGGTETIGVQLPAIITADLRLNEPRFVKLPNLMIARKKTIETIQAAELEADTQSRLSLLKVAEPPARKAGVKVNSVQELLAKLRTEEGIQL
jgi:electron transfer flavoprotein beta subunit